MNDPLIWARAIHFIAAMMAGGGVFFAAFVAEPAFQKTNPDGRLAARTRLQVTRIAWVSLIVALISGTAWLVLAAEDVSDRPLAAVIPEGAVWLLLTRTGFGHDWIARFVLTGLLAAVLLCMRLARQADWLRAFAALIAAALVGTLAWAGHTAGTPDIAGSVHLIADVLHLVAGAAWVGALVPLALLLRGAHGEGDGTSFEIARTALLRFSALGLASVAAILVTGVVNTWFLVGSVPALVGTDYGQLLVVKVVLFLAMVSIAAVNRFRLRPRLVGGQGIDALRQIERNCSIEAALGAFILVIVAVLGTILPGLHQQPVWPFSVQINGAVFREPDLYFTLVFGAAWIALGIFVRRFRWPAIVVGVAIFVLLGFRLPISEAFPTSFYASPTGFSALSIAAGEELFAARCASCHGSEARGVGPAGATLKTKPADLTADHVYEHADGDLFWWITHGIDSGMPAFGDVLDEQARWNLIDFIRANADATRLRIFGAGTIAGFPTPDFSAACPNGSTISIDRLRGQAVHIAIADAGSAAWLREVANRDSAAKLRTIVIATTPEAPTNPSLCVTREAETIKTFALYRGGEPLEGTELLVDPAGDLRSMWRAENVANAGGGESLELRVRGLRTAPRVRRPSGLQGHTHAH